jgi:hypothetical protein
MLKLIDLGNQLVSLDANQFQGIFKESAQDQLFFDSFIAQQIVQVNQA